MPIEREDLKKLEELRAAATRERQRRDEVEEAGDESFPASDPPAYTSAKPRRKPKQAEAPRERPQADSDEND